LLGLVSAATAGTAALVVGLPVGSAAAADGPHRYTLASQGDAMYFEVDSSNIPTSPQNSAGSLTTRSDLSSDGESKAFVGAPYYGAAAETAPGTVNGAMVGFGLSQFNLPITRFPQFVDTRFPTEPKAADEGVDYRISANSEENSSQAQGQTGAPPAFPAPNQQQTSDAKVAFDPGGVATATASGSVAGLVMGPLEIGQAVAKASLIDTGAGKPQITSNAFGRFSVNGQQFGYTENGFNYLGQTTSGKDAFANAAAALEAAGMQLDISPGKTEVNPTTGQTTHIVRGLTVTIQRDLSGNPFTYVYSLGRAMVSGVNVALGAARANTVQSGRSDAGVAPDKAVPAAYRSRAGASSAASDQVPKARSNPAVLPGTTDRAAIERTPQQEPVTRLGYVPTAAQVGGGGGGNEALYLMLAAAGLAVAGSRVVLSRFARH